VLIRRQTVRIEIEQSTTTHSSTRRAAVSVEREEPVWRRWSLAWFHPSRVFSLFLKPRTRRSRSIPPVAKKPSLPPSRSANPPAKGDL